MKTKNLTPTPVERRVLKALGSLRRPRALERLRKRLPTIAHHEAAHYAARAFTDHEFHHVVLMTIIPDGETLGRMLTSPNCSEDFLQLHSPATKWVIGNSLLLEMLAGRAAEIRLGDVQGIGAVLDWESDDWDTPSTDLSRAWRIADLMAEPDWSAKRILRQAEQWTIEMLALPQVWSIVEQVANRLLKCGEIKKPGDLYDLGKPILGERRKLPEGGQRLAFHPDKPATVSLQPGVPSGEPRAELVASDSSQ